MHPRKVKNTEEPAADSLSQFQTLGGHPVLDFCNTHVVRADHSEDRLNSTADMERFFFQVMNHKSRVNKNDYNSLIELRTQIRQLMLSLKVGTGSQRLQRELDSLLRDIRFAPALRQTESKGSKSVQVEWRASGSTDLGRRTIAQSLIDFLTMIEPERLKKCANPNCSHLFYDTSKNKSRNWCSMSSCGNIMKARAFYARKKEQ